MERKGDRAAGKRNDEQVEIEWGGKGEGKEKKKKTE
jgi:hypothetical protein